MKLARADRDVVALTVLALLHTGPRHPYEMHRWILDTHKDFVTGLPRSMYHAVDRLTRAELIVAGDSVRDGTRPERTVYELTDTGRAALRERLRRLLEVPDPDATLLFAALSFLGCLEPAAAAAYLRTRRDTLTARIEEAGAALAATRDQLPRLLLLEVEYDVTRLTCERDWVEQVLADLDDGAIPWLSPDWRPPQTTAPDD